ncbi:integration host factor (IHF) DNA-binding protein beta subunit [Candidatus Regiella insecticola LSR1]|uniref:Integration host factor subunit beta n=2 Tax=Candidatus Regiella insecticola TaxID=138073 RepID=E0WUZ7_9ENTR|nr:integration host factor subunit beta [Candidatus Regiella insecticola]EFL91168.1 integration host factor (IHF) DNA-binding protein beta subunit [Candidatus Regiella insecticola LSR1]
MNKSELIKRLHKRLSHMSFKDVDESVGEIFRFMIATLAKGNRIEIRGFGSFCLHYRAARTGRNPKTGEPVELPSKYVAHFKPGKDLRAGVDSAARPSVAS